MARLLLIRHAPTPETGVRLTGRLDGVSLGPEGQEAAAATGRLLAGLPLAAVYSSPLERTWETAQAVAAPHRLEPIRHDGLLEVDYGTWSGRTLQSLYGLKAWQTVQITPSRMAFPGGESLAAAQVRAVGACEDLSSMHRRRPIALVTHADIIKAVLSHYLGQALDLFQRIAIAPASVSVLDLPRRGLPLVTAMGVTGGVEAWL